MESFLTCRRSIFYKPFYLYLRNLKIKSMKQPAMNSPAAHLYFIAFAFYILAGLSPAHSNNPSIKFLDSLPIPYKPLKKLTQEASFPGGHNALSEFIKANQRYLRFKNNVESNIKGFITIDFLVTKEGKIVQPSVHSKTGEAIKEDIEAEKEAFRLVKLMPDWKPGLIRKKAVNSYGQLVITFGTDNKPANNKTALVEFEAPPPPTVSAYEDRPAINTDLWAVVNIMPTYPEGQAALIRFLDQNLQYPQIAKDNKVEGIIVVQMVVEKDGSLTNLKVLKGLGSGCDEEAIRLIQLMPKWVPGSQQGTTVRVRYNLPIRFRIK